jgi:hypothetical protein
MSEKMTIEKVRQYHLNKVAYYTDELYTRAVQRHQAMADAIDAHLATHIETAEKMSLPWLHNRMRAAQNEGGMVITPSEAKEAADLLDVHIATPAQTVDVEAVRRVVADLRTWRDEGTDTMADKLAQAIGDKP